MGKHLVRWHANYRQLQGSQLGFVQHVSDEQWQDGTSVPHWGPSATCCRGPTPYVKEWRHEDGLSIRWTMAQSTMMSNFKASIVRIGWLRKFRIVLVDICDLVIDKASTGLLLRCTQERELPEPKTACALHNARISYLEHAKRPRSSNTCTIAQTI